MFFSFRFVVNVLHIRSQLEADCRSDAHINGMVERTLLFDPGIILVLFFVNPETIVSIHLLSIDIVSVSGGAEMLMCQSTYLTNENAIYHSHEHKPIATATDAIFVITMSHRYRRVTDITVIDMHSSGLRQWGVELDHHSDGHVSVTMSLTGSPDTGAWKNAPWYSQLV